MSETISGTSTATAPTLSGVWVFDPTAPETTELNFLYAVGKSRTEDIDPGATKLYFAGRANPIVEYGAMLELSFKLQILVPGFDASHDVAVNYWRAAIANKRTLCYRDNRGRLLFLAISGKLGIADGDAGTAIGVDAVRVDYSPVVT